RARPPPGGRPPPLPPPARQPPPRRGRSPPRRPPPPRQLELLRPLPRWHGRACAPCARRPRPRSAACRTWHLSSQFGCGYSEAGMRRKVTPPPTPPPFLYRPPPSPP